MKRVALFASMLLATFTVHAQVYKCLEGGTTVFSDKPCANGAGREIVVRPSSGLAPTPSEASANPSAGPVNSSNNPQAVLANIERERKLRAVGREIDALERAMRDDIKRMNAELDALKSKKALANNNLAGATWEASISQEMLAVTQRYQMKAAGDMVKLEQLRSEQAALAR